MHQTSRDNDSGHHTDHAALVFRALSATSVAKVRVARLHDAINMALVLGIQLQRCAALCAQWAEVRPVLRLGPRHGLHHPANLRCLMGVPRIQCRAAYGYKNDGATERSF